VGGPTHGSSIGVFRTKKQKTKNKKQKKKQKKKKETKKKKNTKKTKTTRKKKKKKKKNQNKKKKKKKKIVLTAEAMRRDFRIKAPRGVVFWFEGKVRGGPGRRGGATETRGGKGSGGNSV